MNTYDIADVNEVVAAIAKKRDSFSNNEKIVCLNNLEDGGYTTINDLITAIKTCHSLEKMQAYLDDAVNYGLYHSNVVWTDGYAFFFVSGIV